MITTTIVSLLPERLNSNGDAENAGVLAKRVELRGGTASVVAAVTPADVPDEVQAVVIGSCDDPSVEGVLAELAAFRPQLVAWMEAGVPVLAVSNGWKLLGERLEVRRGEWVDGLGIISGESPLRDQRASDDLVADTTDGLRLVGYENHARDWTPGVGVQSLGTAVHGRGNGNGSEGASVGAFIGTHLHGPVLAKNPELADRLLRFPAASAASSAAGHDGASSDERLTVLDDYAAKARAQILAGLSL